MLYYICYIYIYELNNIITNLDILFSFRPKSSSAMYFTYNTQLGPPFHIIIDTNFINFSIKNKLDVVTSMMDCLYAKCKLLFDIYNGFLFTYPIHLSTYHSAIFLFHIIFVISCTSHSTYKWLGSPLNLKHK